MADPPEADEGEQDAKRPDLPPWLRPWIVGGLSGFAAWGLFVAVAWHVFGLRHEWLGQWGDSFAPLTGIASTLALVLTTWSVSMQRRELELQRQELRLTRKEMEAQRQEMAAQRAAQEASANAQDAANRIANLANTIALQQGILGCYTIATNIGDVGIAAFDKALKEGTKPRDFSSGTAAVLDVALSTARALKALQQRLEKPPD